MSGTATSSIAPYIDATGIHVLDYQTILAWYTSQYQGIYGSDVYLDPDSQDGQWIAIQALAYSDLCSALVAAYNSFSPATAQGTGLSTVVKINGLTRIGATYSSVDLIISGSVGTTITNGSVKDPAGYIWTLPTSVVIPSGGAITVTATCTTAGAISVILDTQWTINTPTAGWSGVTNASASVLGRNVEQDGLLRIRQAASTMLPAETVQDGIRGALLAISGVTRVAIDENDTSTTNANGTPANGTAWVVEGGDATAIATVIANRKTMGSPTAGSTSETVTDSSGVSRTINFYRPTETTIIVTLTLKALTGYTTAIGSAAATAVAAYIAALPIGATIYVNRLYVPAAGSTYNVTSIQIARSGGTPAATDLPLSFNEAAVCSAANVTVNAS